MSSVPVYGQCFSSMSDSFVSVSVDNSYNQLYPVMSCAPVVAPVVSPVDDGQLYATSTYPVIESGASGAWNPAGRPTTDVYMDRTDRLTANVPELYSSNLSPSSNTFVPGSVRNCSNGWYYG